MAGKPKNGKTNGNGTRKRNGNGNGKKKGGAPKRILATAERNSILAEIRKGTKWPEIVKKCGVCFAKIHTLAAEDESFGESLKKAKDIRNAWRLAQTEDMLDDLALGRCEKDIKFLPPNVTAVIFACKTLGRELYGDKIDHTHGGQISIADLVVNDGEKEK